jgi:peptidoglycan LD-endopeptidase LytH
VVKNAGAGLGIALMTLIISCTSQQGLFEKKTPHEKYSSNLEKAGLKESQLGKLWTAAATKSLNSPVTVNIPYKETGYFEMHAPAAEGYLFTARRGDQVNIAVTTNPRNGFQLFTELWEPVTNEQPKLLAAADTVTGIIKHEIKKDGAYIVRLQPELLQGVAYTITITTAPSLAFPVREKDNPRVISIWGDNRDAGARSHEGIDIQARKRTPAIAIADGTISNVTENNLGGKVVMLRPSGKDYSLYYAHLDEQLVERGQSVKTGDTVGLIGNTGNARFTAPHLHFGIYTREGAVDPLPFVNTNRPQPRSIIADTAAITQYLRVKSNAALYTQPAKSKQQTTIKTGSLVKVLAAADNFYKIQLPDSTKGFITSSELTEKPLEQLRITKALPLLTIPDSNAAIKAELPAGYTLTVLGTYKNYFYTVWENSYGWIVK